MTEYYKFLGKDAICPMGFGRWRLGEWMPPVVGLLKECENGYHLIKKKDLPNIFIEEELYVAEGDGEGTEGKQFKSLFRKARTIRRIDQWNERTMLLYSIECAKKILGMSPTPPDYLKDKIQEFLALGMRRAEESLPEDERLRLIDDFTRFSAENPIPSTAWRYFRIPAMIVQHEPLVVSHVAASWIQGYSTGTAYSEQGTHQSKAIVNLTQWNNETFIKILGLGG